MLGIEAETSKGEFMATLDHGQVQYLNPNDLHKNPAFTNVIIVTGNVKTIYIGGQNAVDTSGAIIGKGSIKEQTEQVLNNLHVALKASDVELRHIIKMTIYIVQGESLQAGFEVFQPVLGRRPNPPAISVVFVSGLANPDFLVEIEAVAVVPQ
jgi:enamine deaminase RidA (YjgF/YER057c/UK114 family)